MSARWIAHGDKGRRALALAACPHVGNKGPGIGNGKPRDEGIGQVDDGDARGARQGERGRKPGALGRTEPAYLLLRCRSKTKRGEKRENIGRTRPCAKGALLGVALSHRVGSGLAFWAARGSMLRAALRNTRREIRGIART